VCTYAGVLKLDVSSDGSWREHFIKTTAPELVQVRRLSVVPCALCWLAMSINKSITRFLAREEPGKGATP
jgi:hypothetical protein